MWAKNQIFDGTEVLEIPETRRMKPKRKYRPTVEPLVPDEDNGFVEWFRNEYGRDPGK
jgi:hypothetical protein